MTLSKNASDEQGMTTPADPAIGVDASHGRRLVAGPTASAQQRRPGSSPVPQVVRSVTAAHPSVAGRKAASRNGSHGEPGGCVAHVAPATPSPKTRAASGCSASGSHPLTDQSCTEVLTVKHETEPTTRERAYFIQGRLKSIRERAASYGSTIDSLTKAMEADHAEAAALEAELLALREAHYAGLRADAEAWAKDRMDGAA